MERTESEEESNDFKKAVKGRGILTFSLSPTILQHYRTSKRSLTDRSSSTTSVTVEVCSTI